MVSVTKTLVSLSVFLSACSSPQRPPVDVKFWYGSSKDVALVRQVFSVPGESVSCKSSKFDDHISMSAEDFSKFFTVFVLGCEKWKQSGFELSDEEKNILDQVVGGK